MKINIYYLIVFLFFAFEVQSQSYSKCKIYTTGEGLLELHQLGIAVDHGIHKKNTFFISDFSNQEIQKMRQHGFQMEVLIDDVVNYYQTRPSNAIRNENCTSVSNSYYSSPTTPSNFTLGSMAGFYTYDEYLAQLDLMASMYPNLITIKDTIGQHLSIQGRPIYYVKISDQANVDETEPEVLYSSIHHAREPLSMTSTIYYMWYLLENYATNDEIKYLVDETEMYFVPLLNPDGYIYNQTTEPNGGGMWRKNRRPNNDGTFGVDLNRNYSHGWGTTGISFDPSDDTYPGTGAFSEPETQAMKWFCEQRDFSFAFNAHTYSNLILFPLGTETNVFADDHDYFQNIGNHMVQYSNFIAQKASDLYPASGDSDDYMYMDDLSIKPKIFAFTPEIGSDNDGFWPTEDRILPLCQNMFFSNLVLAHAAHNYWTVKEIDGSNITAMQGFFSHQSTRLGIDNSALTVSIEPLMGILSVGAPIIHTLALNATETSQIAYELLPNLALGSEIKYVLVSDFGAYIQRDTITKLFGNPSLSVLDEANTNENWIGNWDLTNEAFFSPSSSFTDSPNANYSNGASKNYLFDSIINLTNASAAKIEFNAKWSIENNYDYVAFEVSTNNGVSWIPQCGNFTNIGTSANGSVQPDGLPIYDGEQTTWVLEEINLNDYLGEQIKVRFSLEADGGVTEDGFYFDDFKVYMNTSANNLNEMKVVSIKLFPNPAREEIQLALPNFVNTLQIEILDLNGKVMNTTIENGNFNLSSISIKHLEAGSYIIRTIVNQKDVQLNKFIKM